MLQHGRASLRMLKHALPQAFLYNHAHAQGVCNRIYRTPLRRRRSCRPHLGAQIRQRLAPHHRPATAPSHDEILERAEQLMAARPGRPAKKLIVSWLKSHKESPCATAPSICSASATILMGEPLFILLQHSMELSR